MLVLTALSSRSEEEMRSCTSRAVKVTDRLQIMIFHCSRTRVLDQPSTRIDEEPKFTTAACNNLAGSVFERRGLHFCTLISNSAHEIVNTPLHQVPLLLISIGNFYFNTTTK